jgi:hypothetical protein
MRSGPSILDRAVPVDCERKAAAYSRLAAAPSSKRPEARRRWRFGCYGALFAMWFEQGERGGRRRAHQRLVDGGGAAEMTCGDEGRTRSWALTGEGVAASVACFQASG